MAKDILSGHFLQNFLYSNEPFAVLGGRLYTLSRANGDLNGHDSFRFLGRAYALNESEEVSQLEKSLITSKAPQIERAMSEYIKVHFIDKIDQTKSHLSQAQNFYVSMQDNSIENFIMLDVFDEYNHEQRTLPQENVQTNNWDDIPQTSNPGVEDLISKSNSLDPLVGRGIISIGNRCYSLYENGGTRDEKKGYVIFRGKVLDFKPGKGLDVLCQEYTQNLGARITQKAKEHGSQFEAILSRMDKEKRDLQNAISKKQTTGKTQSKRGEIGFRKVRDNLYEISVTIPPYIIEKDGDYYGFGSVKIGTNLSARNNQIKINDIPKVLSMPYLHPFVWDNGSICFGKLNWQSQRGVNFSSWYNLSNRRSVARKIAKVMRESKMSMEHGYIGSPSPVRNITSCKKISGSRSGAESYARSHNIPIERIIKNE